jgi:predicted amidohydrolase
MPRDSIKYPALALQTHCYAVNQIPSQQERSLLIAASINRLDKQIRTSKGFINSLTGLQTQLIVLPEYFLTGFPMGESIPEWATSSSIHPQGVEYQALQKLCVDNVIYLSGNCYELDEHFPGLYFQTSFIISPVGEVILRYRRLISMFAPTPHDVLDKYVDIYGAESLFPVVKTEIGNLAAIASEEILYPEIARTLALKGAEVICHSSSEISSPLSTPKNIAKQARAYENNLYIISANSAGISGTNLPEHSADGNSKIIDYHGRIEAEAANGESMAAFAELDISGLRETRRRPGMMNTLSRQRLELFQDTYCGVSIYPANTMLDNGNLTNPTREHFKRIQEQTIEKLIKLGVIS